MPTAEPLPLYAPGDLNDAIGIMLDRAPSRVVLAVGDVMLDRFVSGTVERISPEGPILILAATGETVAPGGVGNAAANVRALGGRSEVIAVTGADADSDFLADLLKPSRTVGFVRDDTRPTAVKTRFIAGGQQLLRIDKELAKPISAKVEERIVDELERRIPHAHALSLSDYGKGVPTDRVVRTAISAARAAGIPVVVDPRGRDYARYRGATVVTPNLKELADAAGPFDTGDAKVEEAARSVIARSGVGAVVATRGADGLTVVRLNSPAVHISGQVHEVFDVSGAGDTVVGTLALALAAGLDLVTAARITTLAASLVVAKLGTAPATADELREAADAAARPTSKLRSLPGLTAQVARWRRRGLKVGFTNGCFDLLHPGHLSLIRQARAACDRLVVALNSDRSARRLKGPGRPATDEAARATVLSALGDVDAVVIFEDETPIRLIETLRPDILIKGADYSLGAIVGADFVIAYGGRVVRATLEPGYSTTATIARLGGR
jgi:D-beta-D-heptose 7-phosphate kinase/D-beta-D-heptose 1-phosphate adenosyltransferase